MLNPTELVWAGLKNYVRDKNISNSLSDVQRLAYRWMTSLNRVTVVDYLNETCKIQDIIKKPDRLNEKIEEQSVDGGEEVNSVAEEMIA